MKLGLFVTRWHGGSKEQSDTDEMLAWADKMGVTDLYIGCHEDQSTYDKTFDYLTYILANRGTKRVYAWVSKTVGRDRKNNWTKNRMLQLDVKTVIRKDENWDTLRLDLTDPKTYDYFMYKISYLLDSHRDLDGVWIDGDPLDGPIIRMYRQNIERTVKLMEGHDSVYLYCYGKFSFWPQETKDDLLKSCNAISKL